MMIQNLILSSESYTHDNWGYKDVFVGFSRLYYIIDGEGYYEENGQTIRLKPNHIYLTPVKKPFSLFENSNNKLLHTYAHITTLPAISKFTEIEVSEGSPLADAVALWRKYAQSDDKKLILNILRFVLSCIEQKCGQERTAAKSAKDHIDHLSTITFDMAELCRAVGYSREHITRSFLATYQSTPKQYFNQRRMNVALEKLLAGTKVSTVAEELHFATPYSFSKAFKKHFGLSPEKYLQTLKTP